MGIPDHKIFQGKDLVYNPTSDLIGSGGFAVVYKAVLQEDTIVAFKKPFIGGSHLEDTYV